MTGTAKRSMTKPDVTKWIAFIYGYPPRNLYRRFLDVKHWPKKEIEITLYILGCLWLPIKLSELPSALTVYINTQPQLGTVIRTIQRKNEYRWTCQSFHGQLTPVSFVEALVQDKQVDILGSRQHHFPNDHTHPYCPMRAYQYTEVRDLEMLGGKAKLVWLRRPK